MDRKRVVSLCTTASLLVCQVLGSSGCGWFFTHGPPKNYQGMSDFSCTQSIAGPVLDVVGFVWFTVNGTINGQHGALTATVIDAAASVAFMMSGTAGAIKVRNCRAARAQFPARPGPVAGPVVSRPGPMQPTGLRPSVAQPSVLQPAPAQPAVVQPAPAQPKGPKGVSQQPAASLSAPAQPATPNSVTRRPAASVAGTPRPAGPLVVQVVAVSPAVDSLRVGQTVQLTAVARSSSGTTVPYRSFAWRSSHRAVASVTSAGLVTARAVGVAIITANTGGVVGRARAVVVRRR